MTSIADLVPEPLRAMGPSGLEVWQWLGLVVVLIIAYLLGRLGATILTWFGTKLAAKTATRLDDDLVRQLRSPLRLVAGVGFARIGVLSLDLPARAALISIEALQATFAIGLVWGALRSIDVMASHLGTAHWAASRPSSRAVLSLMSRVTKVLVIVIASIGFLSGIGLPVASLLAGLGIGGIALAFGAQKTVENLFGAVAIGVDQPFREGDYVKIDADVQGTIETVGLRSTRIRTVERTVITMPNGRLADMKIETFARRDRMRFATTLGLLYGTSADKLREILAELEQIVRDHPGTTKEDISVKFRAFGASSLDVDVFCFFQTADVIQYRTWRQELLLAFMDVVERKSGFAFPTQTLHVLQKRP